jgi:hypothetical protein
VVVVVDECPKSIGFAVVEGVLQRIAAAAVAVAVGTTAAKAAVIVAESKLAGGKPVWLRSAQRSAFRFEPP